MSLSHMKLWKPILEAQRVGLRSDILYDSPIHLFRFKEDTCSLFLFYLIFFFFLFIYLGIYLFILAIQNITIFTTIILQNYILLSKMLLFDFIFYYSPFCERKMRKIKTNREIKKNYLFREKKLQYVYSIFLRNLNTKLNFGFIYLRNRAERSLLT